ncbi:MAG: Ldh family oxidoreductase [Pirellulales bacterium]|nr:Ldh family oxidoreductase [Pirellulales bacterium]
MGPLLRLSESACVRLAEALLRASGAPHAEAELVAGDLTTSSLLGVDSHGMLRLPEYLDQIACGSLVPGAAITVQQRSAATAIVDCGYNFGQVGARRAAETAWRLASEAGIGCAVTLRCGHVGRLGSVVEWVARQGMLAVAACNSPVHGHFVVPFGGREGRLATNPLAYAVPCGGEPLVADISTSVAPEGKIRTYLNRGLPLPEGWAIDAAGRPTTDARAFYGPPRGGLLPLGGASGHKGFALGLLVEILGNTLAGHACTDPTLKGNGLWVLAVDPAPFVPPQRFRQLVDELMDYVKSSPPAEGFAEVLVPGEPERRMGVQRRQEGIPIDAATWAAIERHAARLGVSLAALAAEAPG